MYVFERQVECHLSPEQLKTHKDSFMAIFDNSLADSELKVRVAALRATCAFLISLEAQEAIVDQFRVLIPKMIATVIDSLKTDPSLGSQGLESIVDLSKTQPQFWKDSTADLVKVVAEIVKT
jgi:hypothetical protein